jgi:hypothetical protein
MEWLKVEALSSNLTMAEKVQEEIKRIAIWSQPKQIDQDTNFKKSHHMGS